MQYADSRELDKSIFYTSRGKKYNWRSYSNWKDLKGFFSAIRACVVRAAPQHTQSQAKFNKLLYIIVHSRC